MEPITIVILAVLAVIAITFAAIVVAVSIYAMLNPRTLVESFQVSATHLCQSSDCGLFVKFKITNIYDDTSVSLQVFRDGLPQRFLVEGAPIEEYNESFDGTDTRLFDKPGVYELQLLLGGNTGYYGPAISRPLPGPGIERKTITLLPDESETRVRYQVFSGTRNNPSNERFKVTDEAIIVNESTQKELGDFTINCKYTEISAITLVESSTREISDDVIAAVQFEHDRAIQQGLAGFLSPQDDPAFEDHTTEVDVSIVTSDGNTIDLGRLVVGQTSTLDNPIKLDQSIRILSSRHSGAVVPFYPQRSVIWKFDIHVNCI